MTLTPVQARLAELKREVRRAILPRATAPAASTPRRRTSRRATVSALLVEGVKIAAMIVLPFTLYVRGSVFFYLHGASPWIAVILSAACALGAAALVATWFSRRFSGRARAPRIARRIALPVA